MATNGIRERFAARFDRQCLTAARAPGRVNLIGEHTDYNDGFVLPIATTLETRVAGAPRADSLLRVYSSAMNEMRSWSLGAWRPGDHPGWTAYLAGVVGLLCKAMGREHGYDLLIESTVPLGGGLSSSAALEIATASAILEMCGKKIPPMVLIDLCRKGDHEYVGVPCGILDQTASLLCEADSALLLDCRSREIRQIPCNLPNHVFLVVNSGVRHAHAGGEYARRQEECRRAMEYLRVGYPDARALRDLSTEMLDQHMSRMDPLPAARARHVVTENERTLAAADALERGDVSRFGRLMVESHRSLRDDYQVSCPELDELVRLLTDMQGVCGARMTGGGFGGCVVALVDVSAAPRIEADLREQYQTPDGEAPTIFRALPAAGASIEYRA